MSIHQILKDETKALHVRLESDLNLLDPDLSLNDYQEILKRFYGFYRPLEERMKLSSDLRKTSLLEQDLAYFNIDLKKIVLSAHLPATESSSHLMGIRYVIEGSTLGGMVLTKHFAQKFNLSPSQGLAFFSGYQEATIPNWKAFLEELSTFSKSKFYNESYVIAGGKQTFELLYTWLVKRN